MRQSLPYTTLQCSPHGQRPHLHYGLSADLFLCLLAHIFFYEITIPWVLLTIFGRPSSCKHTVILSAIESLVGFISCHFQVKSSHIWFSRLFWFTCHAVITGRGNRSPNDSDGTSQSPDMPNRASQSPNAPNITSCFEFPPSDRPCGCTIKPKPALRPISYYCELDYIQNQA